MTSLLSEWARRMGVHICMPFPGGDCWHPKEHAEHHRPHPRTGREICWLCHPPIQTHEVRNAA
jgi:hypothetical protein